MTAEGDGRGAQATVPDEAPAGFDDLRARILAASPALPKRLQQCADFILAHPHRIAVSTVADVAEGAGVQPSAVMRFCQAVGFSGFSEMQRLYREVHAQSSADYATRLSHLRRRDGSPARLLGEFVEAGHKSLSLLAETLDLGALDQAVVTLRDAAVIHVVGLRRSLPAASYLSYVFDKMQIPVMLHSAVGGVLHRHAIRPGDALIAITFPPYSRETVDLVRHASAQGTPVVALTDGPKSPIMNLAQVVLPVREVDVGAFRSLSATLSLATALAVAVGTAKNNL